ncbi:MAG: hypothetical protein KDB27_25265 [Planctomycetales bacterium]|nr:hypothetical protein [Planctomycetales bacterium]
MDSRAAVDQYAWLWKLRFFAVSASYFRRHVLYVGLYRAASQDVRFSTCTASSSGINAKEHVGMMHLVEPTELS